ncbi:helix-turn-helix domain-containing protein [Kitasatospora sp. NPDC098652]|uniref:helix-turn-helix domain-containing protein n=1 Tax=Kitasatospora sp. NPDC098652 TaxID=3364095 RepID=UPI00380F01D6
MSDGTWTTEAEEFARLLSELKTRSGLSYRTLAKRLHTSTSTLHRYCNGTALPHEFASVERFARSCRATPEEVVELHRSWILADAVRGRRAEQRAPEGTAADQPAAADLPTAEANLPTAEAEPVVSVAPEPPAPTRRRRNPLIVSATAVALLAAVLVVARPVNWGAGGEAKGDQQAAGATAAATAATTAPTAATTGSTATTGAAGPTPTGTPTDSGPAPLTVDTRPYVYADPCSQHFLVNSGPAQVGPPAPERDAPRWAAAYGAVSAGEQEVALTVQGTGTDTVVLLGLHVRVTAKGAPLAWNDYSMGIGCGGGVDTKSFDIDLDRGSPVVTVKGGQRDFPYKVSKSDPEVFYVTAHTEAHDVRWDLALDWSSGDRHGTVRIDNGGTPFRTSADVDRPGFDYPSDRGEWIKRGG